jgi:hypothetical protein
MVGGRQICRCHTTSGDHGVGGAVAGRCSHGRGSRQRFRSCLYSAQVDLERVDEFSIAFRGTRSGSSNLALGAPSPTPREEMRRRPGRGLGCVDPSSPRPRTPVQVVGLGALPNPVVARAAVPDLLARQFRTERSGWVRRVWLWSRSHPCFVQVFKVSAAGTARSPVHGMSRSRRLWAVLWAALLELISRRGSDGHCARVGRDHKRSRSTQQERSRPGLACQQVGDGRQGDHGVR